MFLVVDFLMKDLQLFCQSGFYDRMAEVDGGGGRYGGQNGGEKKKIIFNQKNLEIIKYPFTFASITHKALQCLY